MKQEQQPKREMKKTPERLFDEYSEPAEHFRSDRPVINKDQCLEIIEECKNNWQKEHSYSEQEQWVSYIDNPPKRPEMIIGYNIDGTMEIAFHDGLFNCGFTHWCKLPAPPKQ